MVAMKPPPVKIGALEYFTTIGGAGTENHAVRVLGQRGVLSSTGAHVERQGAVPARRYDWVNFLQQWFDGVDVDGIRLFAA